MYYKQIFQQKTLLCKKKDMTQAANLSAALWLRGRLRAEVRLSGHQVLVDLAVLHEVAMRAGVHDLALLHDDDGGGALYRGQSVGDDDASTAGARSV